MEHKIPPGVTRKLRLPRSSVVRISAVIVAAALDATAALAAPQADPVVYTGCLSTGGTITSVAAGNNPLKPCNSNQVQIQLSAGTINGVIAGTGLTGGGSNGAVTLGIAPTYQLPQTCAGGQFPSWNGSSWACGTDVAYSAGLGLDLTGTTFSIDPAFQMPNCSAGQAPVSAGAGQPYGCGRFAASNQACSAGQVVSGVDSNGNVQCAALPSGPAVYTAHEPGDQNSGWAYAPFSNPIISLNVPAGSFVIHARVDAGNHDGDPQDGTCTLSTGASSSVRVPASDDAGAFVVIGSPDPEDGRMNVVLQDTHTFSNSDTITVDCGGFFHGEVGNGVLTAIQVGSITGP